MRFLFKYERVEEWYQILLNKKNNKNRENSCLVETTACFV